MAVEGLDKMKKRAPWPRRSTAWKVAVAEAEVSCGHCRCHHVHIHIIAPHPCLNTIVIIV
jgi:hypothetical protein